MILSVGQTLHGFTVTRVRRLDELSADLYEMRHDATGAELCWFNDGSANKLFSVTFKTIPEDSTGVFHILEHTVLNGSDRYPVKEPFVELLKSSLNTYLNAMTFPDKTMYPVSSCNTADFLNLTRVYLDAVLHPLIGKNQNIFRQEGWHIELTDRDSEPVYKGVVFNEMKGATSSVDDVVEYGVSEMLFPDSCYRHNSGGDPAVIPSLTYEQYLDTYARFYHPSNARFWLDGDIPLEETLAMIGEEYLGGYTRREEKHDIAEQRVLPAVHHTVYSELAEGEAPEQRAQLVFGRVAASWSDFNRCSALHVLCEALCGSNEAPLTRAILEKGLGQDVSMELNDYIAQPYLTLRIHNTDDDREQEIRSVIRETVAQLSRDGLDRLELEAILNKAEFDQKQPREPQGLIRAIQAMGSWLYGGDPADALLTDGVFAFLREQLKTNYWEELLAEIMDERYLSLLHVLPSATLGEERRRAEADRLAAIRAGWTEEQLRETIDVTKKLLAWQQTPDSPEALATIPVLPLSEISEEPEKVDTAEREVQGVRVLQHTIAAKGIAHVSLYFNACDCDMETLPLLPLFLGALPTARHDARTLKREIKRVIGEMRCAVLPVGREGHTETAGCRLEVRFSVLESRLEEAIGLVVEVLTETRFDDTAKMRELVLQMDEQLRQNLVTKGHILATTRASAHCSAYNALSEQLLGITQTQWMHRLAQGFDERIGDVTEALKATLQKLIGRSRLVVGTAGAAPVAVESLLGQLPEGTPAPEEMAFRADTPTKEGVVIPAQICYAGMAFPTGRRHHGSMHVLRTVVNYSYLWNEVRVKGGAYGSGMMSSGTQTVALYSYRDPSAADTLKAYRAMPRWLETFTSSGEPLDKSILSAVGSVDHLVTPRDKARAADLRILSGQTEEREKELRAELIHTTMADLRAWAPMLSHLEDAAVCVIGPRSALDACADEGLTITEI